MKKKLLHMSMVLVAAGLLFTSCKKESNTTTDNTTELKAQTDDQARFSNETDAVTEDASAALENFGGSYAGDTPLTPQLPFTCDATVTVDTSSNPRTITITYNGATCLGNRTRTGSVVLSFAPGFRWVTAGASYSVTYNNLKITRNSDNKSITINGTKTITNVSGGKLRNLATRVDPIIHTVTSDNMSITFDNGAQRTWKIAKRRTFTYDNGIVIAVSGISTLGNGIAEWGVNRFGNNFTNAILEPLTIKQSCNFRLVSGKVQHTGIATTTITYGLDADGNPVTSCPSGAFYFKAVWTGPNGNTYTYIGPY